MDEKMKEKQERLQHIQVEETKKLKIAETLKEATKIAGELKLHAELYDEEKIVDIFKKYSESFTQFAKELANLI